MRHSELRRIEAASGWRKVALHPVGGLTEVGFSADEAYLLALSHAGRGVIDTGTGARVARDYDTPTVDSPWLRESERLVQGIGPIQGQWLSLVGLWGGKLPERNKAGWAVLRETKGKTELGYVRHEPSPDSFLVDTAITEVRAFGFSPSGRFLVFATSSELTLHEYAA